MKKMMMSNNYPINEIFYSVQGEGLNTGRAAIFVRFSGCNLACPFCDTSFGSREMYSGDELIDKICEMVEKSGCNLLVFTGGEPTLFLNEDLLEGIKEKSPNICLAMESNGTRKVPKGIDFVTISPKEDFFSHQSAKEKARCKVAECDEVKVVYDGENNPLDWEAKIDAKCYFVQPCDTGDAERNREIISKTVEFVKENPKWRISLQTQKILKVR